MKGYRELEIYQESKKLAIEIHLMSLTLPKFELYEEGSQIRRSSKAITANLVEGYSRRRYKADFIRYLIYAQSECDETMTHLEFIYETGSFKVETKFTDLKSKYDTLSKRINKFTHWVDVNWKSSIEKAQTG